MCQALVLEKDTVFHFSGAKKYEQIDTNQNMKINNIVCDACGNVLKGTHGMVEVRKNNIGIRGMVTVFTEDGDYVHITSHAEQDMSFCDVNCFKSLCNRRIEEYEKRRIEALKQEAADDIVYRRNTTY